jgi:hypothetical protein
MTSKDLFFKDETPQFLWAGFINLGDRGEVEVNERHLLIRKQDERSAVASWIY